MAKFKLSEDKTKITEYATAYLEYVTLKESENPAEDDVAAKLEAADAKRADLPEGASAKIVQKAA